MLKKKRILKALRENNKLHTKESPWDYRLLFQQKVYKTEGSGMAFSKN